MAESITRPVPGEITLETRAGNLYRHVARMRYLALAADSIENGSCPTGRERSECVGYLMDTIQYLGERAGYEAERLEKLVKGERE